MLYTVVPLEKIYATPQYDKDKNSTDKNYQAKDGADIEYQEVLLPHGRIITRREGKDYIIEKIHSTDMRDYLNEEYAPGKKVKK